MYQRPAALILALAGLCAAAGPALAKGGARQLEVDTDPLPP